jgi:hypothetical protein
MFKCPLVSLFTYTDCQSKKLFGPGKFRRKKLLQVHLHVDRYLSPDVFLNPFDLVEQTLTIRMHSSVEVYIFLGT